MVKLPLFSDNKKIWYRTLYNDDDMVIGKCKLDNSTKPLIHYHNNATEIYIVIKGEGEVYNYPNWEPTKKGDVHIFPPYTPHCLRSTGKLTLLYIFTTGPFENINYNFLSKL